MEFTNICPITHKNISELTDPVITPDGYTYERTELEKWIRQNGTDPMTRNPLDISQLVVNRAVQKDVPTVQQPGEVKSKKDLTIVWDISGSMLTEASFVNDNGDKENSGLSYHDIVRHAITVIINVLSEEHRLSIVTFSNNAKLLLPLTWMDDAGKKLALDKIKNVQAGGCTDLWGGIFQGLQNNKHGEIYVLTDGIPSYEPPRGWNQQLQKYKQTHPQHSSVVKTFGFGYDLDSKLLHNIAHHFEGSFSFIPDAGFVGTVFIHSLANSLIENKMRDDRKITDFLELLKHLNELSDTDNLEIHREIIKTYKDNYSGGIYEEQIDIACSKDEYYQKWGKHYLRSLYDAHFYQECNNFKDQSVQGYATSEQKQMIDFADDIFCNLPPPEPTISKSYRDMNVNTTSSSISMRCFSQPSGGCFSGECRIETRNGHKLIKNLKKGDLLKTENGYNQLICIMKTISPNGKNKLVELDSKLELDDLKHSIYDDLPSLECIDCEKIYSLGGIEFDDIKPDEEICKCSKLLVTEWHPIKHQNNWKFPIDIHKSKVHNIPYVYSFVVENSTTVYIEGWECITLGHKIKNDSVASHDFWGTEKVIECLKSKPGWDKGTVEVHECVRDNNKVVFLK